MQAHHSGKVGRAIALREKRLQMTTYPLNMGYTLKFLCALLNSTLGTWWFVTNGKRRGVGVDVGVDRLRQFPLPQSSDQFSKIEQLVDRILAAKKKHVAADTAGLEREIDERVYRLYGLTPDEIRLVEESAPLSSRRAEPTPFSPPFA